MCVTHKATRSNAESGDVLFFLSLNCVSGSMRPAGPSSPKNLTYFSLFRYCTIVIKSQLNYYGWCPPSSIRTGEYIKIKAVHSKRDAQSGHLQVVVNIDKLSTTICHLSSCLYTSLLTPVIALRKVSNTRRYPSFSVQSSVNRRYHESYF